MPTVSDCCCRNVSACLGCCVGLNLLGYPTFGLGLSAVGRQCEDVSVSLECWVTSKVQLILLQGCAVKNLCCQRTSLVMPWLSMLQSRWSLTAVSPAVCITVPVIFVECWIKLFLHCFWFLSWDSLIKQNTTHKHESKVIQLWKTKEKEKELKLSFSY